MHKSEVRNWRSSVNKDGFCIYTDTIREGPQPAERDSRGRPVVYRTADEARRALVVAIIRRLQEFLRGDRNFEDAMKVVEYIVEVDVLPDGSVIDADGNHFGSGC